jgi:hypothetical protein
MILENKILNFLVGCEESQAVCIELRKLGHNAFSCDTQECSGNHPEWHFKQDIFEVMQGGYLTTQSGEVVYIDKWNFTITFQPCTDLAVSGCRWFDQKRESGNQEKSIRFFFEVWKRSNCSENPIGIMSGGKYILKYFPSLYEEMLFYRFPFKPSQIIHPYMFGDGERKSTCLFLRNAPKLIPTNIVNIEWVIGKNGKKYTKTHYGTCFKTDRIEQGKLRSKTFPGIAKAMAEQWSEYVLETLNTNHV